MNIKSLLCILLLFTTINSFSQDNLLSAYTIPEELTNANATIRTYDILIELQSYSYMTITTKRVITIFNKNGLDNINSYIYYDPEIKVMKINGVVYDAFGNEIQKFKKKDFKDFSASGGSLYSDNRVLALDYTPINYPFTFELTTKTQTNSTAFFPRWYPIDNYFLSTEHASYKIINHENVQLDVKEFNIDIEGIENLSEGNTIYYKANNLKAIKSEYLSPNYNKILPLVMVAPQKFKLVNVDGYAANWNDFGKWNYDNLLTGRNDLPESAKTEVANLVKGISDPVEKAKLIYQYVQDKTRYISVQLGVGGWQPILASKVDEVSYGDCKALTNYTKALMESQGITTYYTVVYGDNDLRDIESEFVGMQGNHVILNVPHGDESIWLECTSQKVPFGHIANFTDDRDVMVITPEGGRIEHTRVYSSKENYLKAKATIFLNEKGGFTAHYNAKAGGTRYDKKLQVLEEDSEDKDVYYKDYWNYINDITLTKIELNNNRDDVEITEDISLSAPSFGIVAGQKLLISANVFKRSTYLPPRYSERKLPFIIQRGYLNEDVYEINLPEGYTLESIPENNEIQTKFGKYNMSIEKESESKIIYKRTLEIVKGDYEKEDYKSYRAFRRKIAKADKSSIVLNKLN
jgi:transglutaminase-like putative cysteine protease